MIKYIIPTIVLALVPAMAQEAPKQDAPQRPNAEQMQKVREVMTQLREATTPEARAAVIEKIAAENPELAERIKQQEAARVTRDAQRAADLKKYDKDADGKLSEEERAAMMEDIKATDPERFKQMQERQQRGGQRGEGRGPRPEGAAPGAEGRPQRPAAEGAAPGGEGRPQRGEGQGRGQRGQRGGAPAAPAPAI